MRFYKKSLSIFSLYLLATAHSLLLAGCSGSVNDQENLAASSTQSGGSGETSQNESPGTVGAGSTVQEPAPNAPPQEADNNSSETGSNGTVGNGNGTDGPSTRNPPVIKILNIKGGEYLPGGSIFSLFFSVTNQQIVSDHADMAMSKIEYQKPGEAADVWHLVQDKVVSVSGDTVEVLWHICSPTDPRIECLGHIDGSGYKLRVSTLGTLDLTAEVTSTTFTIDSTKPNLTSATLAINPLSTPVGSILVPFVEIVVSGIVDSISPIESICVKEASSTTPTSLDTCWVNVVSLGVTEALTLSEVKLIQFMGFKYSSGNNFYLWGKDKAGNISDLQSVSGKDKISYNYNPPTESATHGYWNDSANSSVTKFSFLNSTSSGTIVSYTGLPVNNNTTFTDPGSIVVGSKGQIYIKDNLLGIVRLNPLTQVRDVILPKQTNFTDGLLSNSSTGVKNPLRIALDVDDGLWILDESYLAFVDFSEASPQLKIMAGGGTSVSDSLTDPKTLQITYHDNTRWYGTFAVLPDKTVVFHSDNPHKILDNSTHDATLRHKLRLFRPKENTIESFYLSGSYNYSNQTISVDGFYPYGPMTFIYNFSKKQIENVFGRFCNEDGSGGCSSSLLKFNDKGVVLTQLSTSQVPYLYNNFPLISQNSTSIYGFNGIKANLAIYDNTNNNWTKILGYNQRSSVTFCNNGTSATSCNLRLTDVFVQKNGTIYFIDDTRIRVIDTDGTIQTLYEPPVGP